MEIPQFFLRIRDCCYGCCDQFCEWWIWLSGLSMIGYFNCLITANCPITQSDYSSTEWLVKNKGANAPITFEEIVMVVIKKEIDSMLLWVCSVINHRCFQNVVRTSVTLFATPYALLCHSSFWRHLWSITELMHGNVKPIC